MIKSYSERWDALNEEERRLVETIYATYHSYNTNSYDFKNGITAVIFELYAHTRRGIVRDSIR